MAASQDENPCAGPMGFITIFVLFFLVMIMFDPVTAEMIIAGMDQVMAPIKFGNQNPIWTIFISGVILVIITTLIRHKFTDWYDMAKTQKIQSEFSKELRGAQFSGNTVKVKKLTEMQPQIMAMTNKIMITNMKTMVFTMLIAIIIWRWLYSYLGDLTVSTISLPWETHWKFTDTIPGCFVPFPYWIAIYFVVSVPIGQVLVSVFKVFEFSKEARVAEENVEDNIQNRIDDLETKISNARRDGVPVSQVESLKSRAENALFEKNYVQAENHLSEAEGVIDQNIGTLKRTQELLETTRTMVNSAKAKGVSVGMLESILANAEAAMARHDYTKAIYYSKQCQQKLKTVKDKHAEAGDAISEIKEYIKEKPESVRRLMAEKIEEAQSAMNGRNYEQVIEIIKKLKVEADSAARSYEQAEEQIERAKGLINNLNKLSIETRKFEDQLRKAEDKFTIGYYTEAFDLGSDVADELAKLKKLYEEASESVSFAKLIVANAKSFGAVVDKAEMLLTEAESALNSHDYPKALSKATSAKNIAEDAKKIIQRQQKRSRQ